MTQQTLISNILSQTENIAIVNLFRTGMLPVFRTLYTVCSDEQQRHILETYIEEMGIAQAELNAESHSEGVIWGDNGIAYDLASQDDTYQDRAEEYAEAWFGVIPQDQLDPAEPIEDYDFLPF